MEIVAVALDWIGNLPGLEAAQRRIEELEPPQARCGGDSPR